MRSRPFYLLAIVLLTAVLPVSIASQVKAARAASLAARAAEARATGARDDTDRARIRTYVRDSSRLSVFAAGLFVCGVGAWAFSLSHREGGLQGIPLLLTVMGILVQLILV